MFRLRALGGLSLEQDGAPHEGAASQRRRLALLVLLAGVGKRGLSREKLIAYLWPEAEEQRARHSLDDALSALRRELRCDALFHGTATLCLNAEALPSDISDFDQAVADGDLERAVGLYAGPFLDGFHLPGAAEFDRWADTERHRLAGALAGAVEALAERARLAGDLIAAADWWRRAVTADPLSTRGTVGLVRALAALGHRSEALRVARMHVTLLERDLQLEPDAEFAAVVEAVRAGTALPAPERSGAGVLGGSQRPASAPRAPAGAPDASASGAAAAALPGESESPRGSRPAGRTFRRRRAVSLAVAAILVSAAGLARLAVRAGSRHPQQAVSTRAARRIAIGSFTNATGDPRWDALGGVARDALGQALEKSGFDVIPTPSPAPGVSTAGVSLQADSTVLAVARSAGARMTVEGTVYLEGGDVRLQARVTDVQRGTALGPLAPVAARRDDPDQAVRELSGAVLGVVASALNPQMAAWTSATGKPRSLEAYEEFAAGLAVWPDYPAALAHFERAAALDSTFAMAAVETAAADRMLGRCAHTDSIGRRLLGGSRDLAPFERLQMEMHVAACHGDQAAQYETARLIRERMPDSPAGELALIRSAMDVGRLHEAVALLDSLDLEVGESEIGPTYPLLYVVVLHALGRHRRELEVCEAARRRFPSNPVLAKRRLMALAALGRVSEVMGGLGELLAMPLDTLDPDASSARFLSADLRVHGHDAEAQVVLQRALAALGGSAPAARWKLEELGNLLYDAGRLQEASRMFHAELELDTSSVAGHGQVALAAARLGDTATARREDAWLAGHADPYEPRSWLFRARIAAVSGRGGEAVAFLRYWWTHASVHLGRLQHYPLEFLPLRHDPALVELMRVKD